MASDASSGGGGGADRSGHGEAGRPDDSWRRIETERPERDAARKAWDTKNDPSPEFEHATRPLGNDYGRDRPQHRELTAEQRADLEETFGRPADELLALREQDPRASHNRDQAGRILDHDGNPRPERTPEQILREAERQAELYSPDADASTDTTSPSAALDPSADRTTDQITDQPRPESQATSGPDLQAPSDQPDETNPSGETDDDAASDSDQHDSGDSGGADGGDGDGPDLPEAGHPGDDPGDDPGDQTTDVQRTVPAELHAQLGDLATELRSGRMTPAEAADHLDNLHPDSNHSPRPHNETETATEPEPEAETRGTVPYDEPSTETIDTKDGLTYERPERREGPNFFEARPGDQSGFKELRRVAGSGGHDLLDGMKEMGNNLDTALQEVVVPEPRPTWQSPQYAQHEGGAGDAAASLALLGFAIATGVHAARERWNNRKSDTS